MYIWHDPLDFNNCWSGSGAPNFKSAIVITVPAFPLLYDTRTEKKNIIKGKPFGRSSWISNILACHEFIVPSSHSDIIIFYDKDKSMK